MVYREVLFYYYNLINNRSGIVSVAIIIKFYQLHVNLKMGKQISHA